MNLKELRYLYYNLGLIRKSEVDSGVVDTEADQLFEDANDTNADNQQDNEEEGDIEDLL